MVKLDTVFLVLGPTVRTDFVEDGCKQARRLGECRRLVGSRLKKKPNCPNHGPSIPYTTIFCKRRSSVAPFPAALKRGVP